MAYRGGRPKGHRLSQASKEKISASQKRRWAMIRQIMRDAEARGTLPEGLAPAEHAGGR